MSRRHEDPFALRDAMVSEWRKFSHSCAIRLLIEFSNFAEARRYLPHRLPGYIHGWD